MAKYLVTGGAGFIGTNLVIRLHADGHEVVVLDNYRAGHKEERIQKEVKYIEGDIRDLETVKEVCKGTDGIFHLAAVPRVSYSVEHPIESHDANVNGTLHVLVAARDCSVPRVVFASSGAVYGEQLVHPFTEDMVPNPVSPYGLQKWIGEKYCQLFFTVYGIQTVALRYFNVYGPYYDPTGAYALAFGKFLMQRKNGEPMTICGDGEYYRDYTYVDDVVSANTLAMINHTVGKGEILNIGFGHAYSVNELASVIGGPTVPIPPRPGDMRYSEANTQKARELLGWQPSVSLQEGIVKLKEWYKVQ